MLLGTTFRNYHVVGCTFTLIITRNLVVKLPTIFSGWNMSHYFSLLLMTIRFTAILVAGRKVTSLILVSRRLPQYSWWMEVIPLS